MQPHWSLNTHLYRRQETVGIKPFALPLRSVTSIFLYMEPPACVLRLLFCAFPALSVNHSLRNCWEFTLNIRCILFVSSLTQISRRLRNEMYLSVHKGCPKALILHLNAYRVQTSQFSLFRRRFFFV